MLQEQGVNSIDVELDENGDLLVGHRLRLPSTLFAIDWYVDGTRVADWSAVFPIKLSGADLVDENGEALVERVKIPRKDAGQQTSVATNLSADPLILVEDQIEIRRCVSRCSLPFALITILLGLALKPLTAIAPFPSASPMDGITVPIGTTKPNYWSNVLTTFIIIMKTLDLAPNSSLIGVFINRAVVKPVLCALLVIFSGVSYSAERWHEREGLLFR